MHILRRSLFAIISRNTALIRWFVCVCVCVREIGFTNLKRWDDVNLYQHPSFFNQDIRLQPDGRHPSIHRCNTSCIIGDTWYFSLCDIDIEVCVFERFLSDCVLELLYSPLYKSRRCDTFSDISTSQKLFLLPVYLVSRSPHRGIILKI